MVFIYSYHTHISYSNSIFLSSIKKINNKKIIKYFWDFLTQRVCSLYENDRLKLIFYLLLGTLVHINEWTEHIIIREITLFHNSSMLDISSRITNRENKILTRDILASIIFMLFLYHSCTQLTFTIFFRRSRWAIFHNFYMQFAIIIL